MPSFVQRLHQHWLLDRTINIYGMIMRSLHANLRHGGGLIVGDAPELIQSDGSWDLQSLLASHGELIVRTSLVSKVSNEAFPADGPSMRIKEFVDLNSTKYSVFQKCEEGDMFAFNVSAIPAELDKLIILSMAKGGSSTAFHNHGVAAFFLVSGIKLWLLAKRIPAAMQHVLAYQTGHELLQHREHFDEWGVTVLLQRPGQIVVVPYLWYHSTINLETAIGVSYQGEYNITSGTTDNEHSCIGSFQEGQCSQAFRICTGENPYQIRYWEECIGSWDPTEAREHLQELEKHILATSCIDCEYEWTRVAFMWARLDVKKAVSCLKRALKANPSYIQALMGAFALTNDEKFEKKLKKLYGRFPSTPPLQDHFEPRAEPEL
ncbi:unnamed protein product [Prorocentrum cordatum]|uniref:JmjC domain-containing protein n=1 Tax=Prorocentrum cordatum TaxID=2364126 RepID=A0ABN9REJ0_9DINO|nr:unnamed protein product [Polarella glacialis]